jgi:hypothetical protein
VTLVSLCQKKQRSSSKVENKKHLKSKLTSSPLLIRPMEKAHSRHSSMSSDASPPRYLATSSPLHPHHRRNDSASLLGGSRRRQNTAARAAAQRLARAMASTGSPENSSAEEDDLDDDLSSVHSFDTSTPRRSSIRCSISQTVRKTYLFSSSNDFCIV